MKKTLIVGMLEITLLMDQRSWGDLYALFRRYCYKTHPTADAPEMIYFQLNARSKQLKHSVNNSVYILRIYFKWGQFFIGVQIHISFGISQIKVVL